MLNKITFCLVAASAVSLDREPLLTWAPSPPKGHPVDYFVPNFGKDFDIKATEKHVLDSETKLNHKWTPVLKGDPHPTDYFVPKLGLDRDILDASASIKSVESTLDHEWKPVADEDGMFVVPEAANASSYSYK